LFYKNKAQYHGQKKTERWTKTGSNSKWRGGRIIFAEEKESNPEETESESRGRKEGLTNHTVDKHSLWIILVMLMACTVSKKGVTSREKPPQKCMWSL
jgi:hypothetical protein